MSSELINKVLELTNKERIKIGLNPLKINYKLVKVADFHSENMANQDFFSHTGKDGSSVGDRVKAIGYQYSTTGENIAAGYQTAETVVRGWMNSSGHRANILNPNYTEIGIGYEFLKDDTGSINYHHYWTQVFGKPLNQNNSDILIGSKDDDKLVGNNSDNIIKGKNGQDYLEGRNGNDILRGDRGSDTLLGGAGNDRLLGGADDDLLDGASGSNISIGGSGSDTFILRDTGIAKIRDFELGTDSIGLADNISFNDLEIRGKNSSSIFYEGEKIAILAGINPDSLTAENFTDF